MLEDSCVLAAAVPVQQAILGSHIYKSFSHIGDIMASSVFVAMQYIYLLLVSDPPRFYILLLLVFMSLVILVKAGIFDEDHPYVRMDQECAGEPNSIVGADFDLCPVEISSASEMEEELEIGIDKGMMTTLETGHENNDEDQNEKNCECSNIESCYKGSNLIGFQEDDAYTTEDGEEDIEELNNRVEAYILKVRMGFYLER